MTKEKVLRKVVRKNTPIEKILAEKEEKELKSNLFWGSVKGKFLTVFIMLLLIFVCIFFAMLFRKPGYFLYVVIVLVLGFWFIVPNRKPSSKGERKISKKEIDIMKKSLAKPHLEYQKMAVTDCGIINLSDFLRIKYEDVVWVYQTEENLNIAMDMIMAAPRIINRGVAPSSDVRTFLVLRTKNGDIFYLPDHTSHYNGIRNMMRKTYKCSKEFEVFWRAITKKLPKGTIYGEGIKKEKRYYKRIGIQIKKSKKSVKRNDNYYDEEEI